MSGLVTGQPEQVVEHTVPVSKMALLLDHFMSFPLTLKPPTSASQYPSGLIFFKVTRDAASYFEESMPPKVIKPSFFWSASRGIL